MSELKRLAILEQQADDDLLVSKDDEVSTAYLHDRPAFMQSRALSAAEIGTAMHTIMQHIDIGKESTVADVEQLITELTERQLLTAEEAIAVDANAVAQFFKRRLRRDLMKAKQVVRELPFTYAFDDSDGDYQILQGIADCLFEEQDGWVLLDYKTDQVRGRYRSDEEVDAEMQERYGIQLNLYKKAIEEIVKIDIKEMVLYLFDGQRTVTYSGGIKLKVTPTTLGNRIEVLDLLRGFALLGIFIANMLIFHSPYLYMDPYTWFSTPGDVATFKWIDIFVEAVFIRFSRCCSAMD